MPIQDLGHTVLRLKLQFFEALDLHFLPGRNVRSGLQIPDRPVQLGMLVEQPGETRIPLLDGLDQLLIFTTHAPSPSPPSNPVG